MEPDILLRLVADLSVPQRLALSYSPRRYKLGTAGLLALDARLAQIVRAQREVVLVQMRLAWWRDMLGKSPGDWPKGDAVLAALRDWQDPAALVPLVDGWEALLSDRLDKDAIAAFAGGRSAGFLALSVQAGLSVGEEAVRRASRTWALADLAAHITSPEERVLVIGMAAGGAIRPLPRALRPLRILAGLGRRALRAGGRPLVGRPQDLLLAMRLGLVGR